MPIHPSCTHPPRSIAVSNRPIQLRGVEVHNLKAIDLDIPRGKLVVFCGLSGSGKSSLAIDTLYAEGQRRYIESFSARARQFLEQLEKPAAERIDGLPPAVAVTRGRASRSSRATVGTSTEAIEYLRLLFAKIGQTTCLKCGQRVVRDSAQTIAQQLAALPEGVRYMLGYRVTFSGESGAEVIEGLRQSGFVRLIVGDRLVNLADNPGDVVFQESGDLFAIVDRLAAGRAEDQRIRESLETAMSGGDGSCCLFVEKGPATDDIEVVGGALMRIGRDTTIDGKLWRLIQQSDRLRCDDCEMDYPALEPRLFSFNSPLGACPECEGFGDLVEVDMDLVVPDASKSLRDGAIAPWTTKAYAHELEELLALADDYDLPVDIPYRDLSEAQQRLVREGVAERDFGGLNGFFRWLERRKYKMHLRVFLSRWKSAWQCPGCEGRRLRRESLATGVGGKNIAEVSMMKIDSAINFFESLVLDDWQQTVAKSMLEQVRSRLGYLQAVGLGYLTLDRTLRTLSGGETQRITLTSALGSSLVNMLYVLDEPSVGLHPRDVDALVESIEQLRNRNNTVVVVEHEEAMIRAADQIVEIGPGAGERGGQVVFQGTAEEIVAAESKSLTGDYLAGRRGRNLSSRRRESRGGRILLKGASGNNLRGIDVEFPLGLLCVVTGVSGSGKSTLVQKTLYPALCRRLKKTSPKPMAFADVFGDGQIDDVVLVDQSPIGRSPRSNPVTYIKAFDEIRTVFAETVEARTHNFKAGHFSFNVDGGRCTACHGDGYIEIDMQLMADVFMKCDQCHGTRYRREILDVKYRGRTIADVLEMTVREAFTFFRGRPKVQAKLKRLIDVGLDYVRLGQPANTLSGGEAQRLKLATHLSSTRRSRSLFLLDEPTTGLHFSDVVQLLDCFEALLDMGNSLIVVEHNMQVITSADHIIDLGPGAADEGGQLVVAGTPEEVAACERSATAPYLLKSLADDVQPLV